jgi:hypothetical protein
MRNSDNRVGLGDRVECKLTGFTGIAVVIAEWLHGCRRIGVQSPDLHEGLPREPHYLDEAQLRVIEPNAVPVMGVMTLTDDAPGGPPREGRGFQRR